MIRLAERRVDAGGVRVRYLIGGSGPHLLLCHGFMGSAENFDAWIDDLAPRRTLVIPDLPGCGLTPPLSHEHTTAALARVVHALADALGVERFDLGGLCLGASVACALVRLCPGRVDRLLLHTPLLEPELVRRGFRVQARVLTAPGVFPAVHWLASQRRISDLYKRRMVEGSDVDHAAAEMNFRNQIRADPRAIREWLRDALRRHDRAVIGGRGRSTMLMVPADDRIADVPKLRAVSAGLTGVELAVIADTGHGWNEDAVRRQLAVITAYLDDRPVGLATAPAAE